MSEAKRTHLSELRELRRVVREYLRVTMFVPFRAVDCDQETEKRLREKLAGMSRYRESY